MSLQRSFQHYVEVKCEIYESQVSASTTVVHCTQQILWSFLHVLNQEIVSFFPLRPRQQGVKPMQKQETRTWGITYIWLRSPQTPPSHVLGAPVEL